MLILLFLMLPSHLWANKDTIKILAFGDSLMAGYGLRPGEGFVDQLTDKFRQYSLPVTVINAGLSGDTTAGGKLRIDWLLAEKPDIVIVELGANDALRGLSPKETKNNLQRILQKIRMSGAKILLAGMYAPPNMGQDYAIEFNNIYPQLADDMDISLHPFFLEGVAGNLDLNLDDGMHPNADGVAVIVENIFPNIMDLIGNK